MSEKLGKLIPVYWFESGIIALCDKDNIKGCDADDDCEKCKHNKLSEVLANVENTSCSNCNIPLVSKQRELLLAFCESVRYEKMKPDNFKFYVDNFLKTNNCG
jgi:hypothetical protein